MRKRPKKSDSTNIFSRFSFSSPEPFVSEFFAFPKTNRVLIFIVDMQRYAIGYESFSVFFVVREPPVNSLPILMNFIDADFTDLHGRYPPDYYAFAGRIKIKKPPYFKSVLICVNLCRVDKKLHHRLPLRLPPPFGVILLRNAPRVTFAR